MSTDKLAQPCRAPSPKNSTQDKPLEEFFLTHDPLTGEPIPDPRDQEGQPL